MLNNIKELRRFDAEIKAEQEQSYKPYRAVQSKSPRAPSSCRVAREGASYYCAECETLTEGPAHPCTKPCEPIDNYEIKVRAPQYQRLFFEVWVSGVHVRSYKRRSSAEAYIVGVTITDRALARVAKLDKRGCEECP